MNGKKARAKRRQVGVTVPTWIEAYVQRREPAGVRVCEFPLEIRNLLRVEVGGSGAKEPTAETYAIASLLLSAAARTCGIDLRPLHDFDPEAEIAPLARCLLVEQGLDSLKDFGVMESAHPHMVGTFLETWAKGLRARHSGGEGTTQDLVAPDDFPVWFKLDPLSADLLDMTRDREPGDWALRWLPEEALRRLSNEGGETGPRRVTRAAFVLNSALRLSAHGDLTVRLAVIQNNSDSDVLGVLAWAVSAELFFEGLVRRGRIAPDWCLKGTPGSTFVGYVANSIHALWKAGEERDVGRTVAKSLEGQGVRFKLAPDLSPEERESVHREIDQGVRRAASAGRG